MSKAHLIVVSFLCLVVVEKAHAEWVPMEDLDSRTLYYRAAYTANDECVVLNNYSVRGLFQAFDRHKSA